MKKVLIIACFLCVRLYSLYYGSPNLPNTAKEGIWIPKEYWLGLKVGYQNDYVFDKSLKTSSPRSVQKIEEFNYYLQQGLLTLNFIDRFEAYGSLGAMRLHIEPRVSGVMREVYQTNNHFAWGFGGRAILFEYSGMVLGLDFKYQGSSPPLENVSQNGFPFIHRGDATVRYREWQIGIGLAYALEMFAPYIGAIYNQSSAQYKYLPKGLIGNNKRHFSVNSGTKFGMALGATLSAGNMFEIDLEARMFNETALSAAANVRF